MLNILTMLFLCVIFLYPHEILAEEVKYYGDYKYQYNEEYEGIEILEYTGEEKKIIVPETIEGIPVTVIEEYAFFYTDVKKLILPESIKVLKEHAIADCEKLESIVLPKNLIKIEKAAFAGCTKLKSIKLPSGLTEIPGSTFSGCTALKKIVIPTNVVSIGCEAFIGCSHMEKVVIPKDSKLEFIDEGAFSQTDISEIKLPA